MVKFVYIGTAAELRLKVRPQLNAHRIPEGQRSHRQKRCNAANKKTFSDIPVRKPANPDGPAHRNPTPRLAGFCLGGRQRGRRTLFMSRLRAFNF
ncbi:hypothetical protein DWUX_755 [Desulfovibrio diazotrophicus]|nr:hypothetical protein DWUX_755 [Desulfovibrio diazotrophicus]VVU43010.1 hypothetical protein DWUX_356 [Desulfovibrio diazotrophicus]